MTDVVSLNVGGTIYTTSRATLTRFPNSMLGSMFSDRLPSIKDDKGNYLIDGDGSLFRYVLNFLRRSILVLPEDFKELDMLAQEADYYQIKELIDAVTRAKSEHVKEQELLEVEVEGSQGDWSIVGSSETLQKIPVLMEAWNRRNRPSSYPIFGPEGQKFYFHRKGNIGQTRPLNRIKFFRQIAQLGFKLSGSSAQETSYRWVFTRD